jgi:hypothetical protein
MFKRLSDVGLKSPTPYQYKQMTVHNAQKDEAAIIKALSAIMHNKFPNDLILLNYYNDMPISFGANIEHIDHGIVAMTVHSFQAVSMILQNTTFLKSDLLPHWVLANVLKIDREHNLAYLTLFSYVQNTSERRMYVRMTLPDMVEASFHNNQQEVPGAVREISFGGVAILAPQENVLKEKEKGVVTLLLPSVKLDVPGVFLKYQEQDSLRRHIFQLKMNTKSERILSQFIYQQQSKIMEEFKHLRS